MTMLKIDPTAQAPPYEQLRRQLVDQIHSGHLIPETRLPAVRRLAADLGLAPGTVARAYKELEAEGYLVTRGRNGTLVAPFLAAEHTQALQLTTEYIAAMQDLGLESETIIAAVHQALPSN